MRRLLRLWLVWLAFIGFISLPWMGFTTEPQWQRVQWIPFDGPVRLRTLRDIFLNTLVFMPLGFAVARRRPPAAGLALAAVMAATISVCAEATQLFSTKRYPSATDVAAAVIGAIAGAIPTLSAALTSKPDTWTD